MDDRYADLRAALDAGPTPGPWTIGNNGYDVIHGDAKNAPEWSEIAYHGGNLICDCWDDDENGDINTARFIAASNPEAIRALLADYDRLERALILTASALGNVAGRGDPVAWNERHTVDGKNYLTIEQIIDAADAALAQEQGGSDE